MFLAFIWIAAAAYLLGSIPVGYLLVRIFKRQDIRTVGSGNIGATNVLRSGSKGLGAATFVLDVVKGALAVLLASLIAAPVLPNVPQRNVEVATGFGVFLVGAALVALAAITVFAIVLAITRYVSLGSILGAASFPVFAWFTVGEPRPAFFIAVQITVALLIIIKHHPNIRRLLAGTENRMGAAKTA